MPAIYIFFHARRADMAKILRHDRLRCRLMPNDGPGTGKTPPPAGRLLTTGQRLLSCALWALKPASVNLLDVNHSLVGTPAFAALTQASYRF